MTGLDPQTDTILSIACILTTSDLQPLDLDGFEAVIQHTPAQLSGMSEWCVRTHGATGLTQRCLDSTTTAQVAADALLAYIKHYIPEQGRALLAGNSIHADKAFLTVPPWNVVLQHLHYRLFDVSAMKEMVRRWASPEVLKHAPVKQLRHSAREDVWESIEEARYYKSLVEGMLLPGSAGSGGIGGGGGASLPNVDGTAGVGNVGIGGDAAGRTPPPPPPPPPTGPNIASGGLSARGPTSSTNTAAAPGPKIQNAPLPANFGAAIATGHGDGNGDDRAFAHAPAFGTKEGQEALVMLCNTGTREGSVGVLDAGFRTDVP